MKITRRRFLAVYDIMVAMAETSNKEVGWFSFRNARKMRNTVVEINSYNQPSEEFVDYMTKARSIATDLCMIDENGQFVIKDNKYIFETEEKKNEYLSRQKQLEIENQELIKQYDEKSKSYLEEEIEYDPYVIEYKYVPQEFSGKTFELLEGFITE